jgi:hypothetical protein
MRNYKLFALILLVSVCVSACQNTDQPFTAYTNQQPLAIESLPSGWQAALLVKTGEGQIYMSLPDQQRIDFDALPEEIQAAISILPAGRYPVAFDGMARTLPPTIQNVRFYGELTVASRADGCPAWEGPEQTFFNGFHFEVELDAGVSVSMDSLVCKRHFVLASGQFQDIRGNTQPEAGGQMTGRFAIDALVVIPAAE